MAVRIATKTFEPGAARAGAIAGTRATLLAGTALALASAVILLGIITAEALYPATYTTHENEISDLGSTRPPDPVILQPSARIFNSTMLAAGALMLASAGAMRQSRAPRRAWISMGLMGLGVFGVGVFPGNYAPHGIFALLAFVAGGLTAVLTGTLLPSPMKQLSILMGTLTLGSLVVAFMGDLTPIWDEMGDGGVERWVAYPVVIWLGIYGGYLLAAGSGPGSTQR